jgi:hypothetical protein
MFIENHKFFYRIDPMIDVHALKQDCKNKADIWGNGQRARKTIKNHPGIFAKNRINAAKWYGIIV